MMGLMNDTKWDELRIAMHELGEWSPRFCIKNFGCDEPWSWDGEWYYHFALAPYQEIEWVDLGVRCEQQRTLVRDRLRIVHVPGVETLDGFRVFGWVRPGIPVNYI